MRDEVVDITKGVGIFLVVLGHFTVFHSKLYHYIYLFHMPLFFFLSGMFYKPEKNIYKALIKRSKRLLFPYAFYWIFCHIISCLNGIFLTQNGINNINFNPMIGGVLWFLISLWTIHVICILSEYIKQWKTIIYSLIFIIGWIMGYYEIKLPLYLSQSMLMLPFFLIGNFCFQTKIKNNKTIYQYIKQQHLTSPIFILATIIYLIPCDFLDINGPIIPHNILQYILTPLAGIIITIILCNKGISFFKRLHIDNLGNHSLHILGVHSPFISIFWYFTIPLILNIGHLFDIQNISLQIKENIIVQFILSIILTYMSYIIGTLFQRLFPKIF